MKTIYFDNAATTPLDSRVLDAMLPWLKQDFGNASSIHHLGRKASVAVEESRDKFAHYFGCTPAEIIFTSGGTESDNTVIRGILAAKSGKHILTSNAEHHAILHPVEHSGEFGKIIKANKDGIITPDLLSNAISSKTALVSLMHVNNENGAINPIKELAEIAHQHGALFHTDAVQSVGKFPISVDDLGLDFLSLSGHKFNGPKGIGALFVRSGSEFKPFMEGGSQERKRRAGTLNVSGIVGLGKAIELAQLEMQMRKTHITNLKNTLESGLKSIFGDSISFNNPKNNEAYHITSCSFYFDEQHFLDGEMLLLNLDIEGICCSNGSACSSGAVEPSHVLLAMGIEPKVAKSSLRISLGKDNTLEEITFFLEKIEKIVNRMIRK